MSEPDGRFAVAGSVDNGTGRRAGASGRIRSLLTRRGPIRLVPEAVLLIAAYAIYTVVRDSVQGATSVAVARGVTLLHVERVSYLDPEHALNRFVAAHPVLAQISDYYYATGHFLITIGVLVLVYWKAPGRARRYAAAWYAMNLLGLLGFWLYALAPPRLLPHEGFVDTVVKFGTWGGWGSHSVATVSNQYAAMPSLHTGWAVWCAITIWVVTQRRWARVLALAYPVLTVIVVLGTANHYLLDTFAGAAVAGAGFGVVAALGAVGRWWDRRALPESPTPGQPSAQEGAEPQPAPQPTRP